MSGFSGGSFSFSRSSGRGARGFRGHSHSHSHSGGHRYGHRGHARHVVRRGGCLGAFVVGVAVLSGAVAAVGGVFALLA
ncbi:hypothetical protein [Deinococcus maricopensis]|uniref:Uncharacterized protein n=1 Tax=Deinococcus maricopensis (strain DSM 21211 / LMG 22137 / NRRL B-23946 / LB-34) TaxID=709986 RepID=E8U690_DEIML|nr:hypothetical protein [Deinococcus maricopensis]ADV66579.1 hypothetical protein Deima_0925 [Deinococcus maricopensis DSM 21211]